jgi:hypothetical protein
MADAPRITAAARWTGAFDMAFQNPAQRAAASAVRLRKRDIPARRAASRRFRHLVRHGIRKQHYEVRVADKIVQPAFYFRKNLCIAVIFLANALVLTLHTLISADDHYVHLVLSLFLVDFN